MSHGPIEKAIRAATRGRAGEPLVQTAFRIASELDTPLDAKDRAALSRELRITLDTLGIVPGAVKEETSVADELRKKRAARQANTAS